ncbi:RHS repeat-associated core domain-containing protein [Clostridium bornimense]|uniref:RHS repeat-associated core domain-containing protein n=1 Tax=Clostridium bornimense TaxID=1216932 RepID=UPI001C0F646F|nr:RHS repeat-associated core domain-containing protein [Clostridium bornimense]MBU5316125.1 RHS repeat-associated core domain-containing protein [Clostridium bornimense]
MNLNGKEYFYIRNVENDVIGLHDTEGKVVVSYSYDTWGNIVSITGSLKDSVGKKNSYRYRGYRYDEETGLYYLKSRYYNAEWGRFINADAGIAEVGSIQGCNMFQYCNNNPVNMSDESGYWPKWMKTAAKAVKKAVSNVVNKVKKVFSSSKSNNKPSNNIKNTPITKNDVSNSTKGGVITAIEGGVSEVYKNVPSKVTLSTVNRAGRRAGQMAVTMPVKGAKTLQMVSKVESIGAVGVALTGVSVWNNYHSGYSKKEAFWRSAIDVALTGVSIMAGCFGGPLAAAAVSLVGGLAVEAFKYYLWDAELKKPSKYLSSGGAIVA